MRAIRLVAILIWLGVLASHRAGAIEFVFEPDTVQGETGTAVILSGQVGPTIAMRGFTVYLVYDTSLISLAGDPEPGSLIASRSGLDFRWLDHVPSQPDWLEIGATLFSDDFWSGPGELFRLHFQLRGCGDVPLQAPYGVMFRTAENVSEQGNCNNPLILICGRVPRTPDSLTITPVLPDSVCLRWTAVANDTLGRQLLTPAQYRIMRTQILPQALPAIQIALVSDTAYMDGVSVGTYYVYQVVARSEP